MPGDVPDGSPGPEAAARSRNYDAVGATLAWTSYSVGIYAKRRRALRAGGQ